MRVTFIRPTFAFDPINYRAALLLHSHMELDSEHKDVDLTSLYRGDLRELLARLEKRTGLVSGVIPVDSLPEEDD